MARIRIFCTVLFAIVLAAPAVSRADACHSDADCVMVPTGCCPCGEGGGKRAVNRESAAAHRRQIAADCLGTECSRKPLDSSCSTVAVCVRRHCVAKPKMAAPH